VDPEFVDKGKVVALFPCILEGELPENGEVVERNRPLNMRWVVSWGQENERVKVRHEKRGKTDITTQRLRHPQI